VADPKKKFRSFFANLIYINGYNSHGTHTQVPVPMTIQFYIRLFEKPRRPFVIRSAGLMVSILSSAEPLRRG
jgi:hypothetical protein